jgi:formate hydrogenlyase subunit 6/NADH:ubiquinone oxidoreductase subunit I
MPYTITEKCSGCGACARICPAEAIEGEKKMRHVIAGRLCIGCGACGRICPEGAVTDGSGAVCHPLKKSLWLKPRFDLAACLACVSCVETCPAGSIGLAGAAAAAGAPHNYPRLENPKRCIGCGFCATDCPVDAITMAAEAPPG